MTTLTSSSTPSTIRPWVHTAGAWCAAAGLLGVVQAAVVLAWPHQVSVERFSYPFTSAGYVIAQATFALQHVPLVIGAAALSGLPGVRVSRVARVGVRAAVVGLALLALLEVVAMSAYGDAEDSAHSNLVENAYAVPVLLTGLGLTVAGAALVRRGRSAWTGARWMPWMVLSLGVYVFFPLSPAISGSFTAGRLGIAGWMLLFAGLGFGLMRVREDH
jgi:hypothetical protein